MSADESSREGSPASITISELSTLMQAQGRGVRPRHASCTPAVSEPEIHDGRAGDTHTQFDSVQDAGERDSIKKEEDSSNVLSASPSQATEELSRHHQHGRPQRSDQISTHATGTAEAERAGFPAQGPPPDKFENARASVNNTIQEIKAQIQSLRERQLAHETTKKEYQQAIKECCDDLSNAKGEQNSHSQELTSLRNQKHEIAAKLLLANDKARLLKSRIHDLELKATQQYELYDAQNAKHKKLAATIRALEKEVVSIEYDTAIANAFPDVVVQEIVKKGEVEKWMSFIDDKGDFRGLERLQSSFRQFDAKVKHEQRGTPEPVKRESNPVSGLLLAKSKSEAKAQIKLDPDVLSKVTADKIQEEISKIRTSQNVLQGYFSHLQGFKRKRDREDDEGGQVRWETR